MTPTEDPDEYRAHIPASPPNTTVNYYIEAQDVLGSSDTSPAAAPQGSYEFEVKEPGTGWGVAEMEASVMKSRPSLNVAMNDTATLLLLWKRRERRKKPPSC